MAVKKLIPTSKVLHIVPINMCVKHVPTLYKSTFFKAKTED
jgi:hypothetical protein